METALVKFNLELISMVKESVTTHVSSFDDPEDWEEEAELFYRQDLPQLLRYQEQVAKKKLNRIDEQWKLCGYYINNGLYEKALNYLTILYKEDPEDKNIINSVVEVLQLLGLSEDNFPFEKCPTILHLNTDLLDMCYELLLKSRKAEAIINLYCNLGINADYLDFEEVGLVKLLKQDERFLINDQEIPRLTEVCINKKFKNKKTSGHYCWCCGRLRPNEAFSGKNHGRHLCKECSKLDVDELKFRQIKINDERLIGWSEVISHKNKRALEKYRDHNDVRISELVNSAFIRDIETRSRWKSEHDELEERQWEYSQINHDNDDESPF
jgi:tetratricopeptide (TPR) repeat protein